MDSRVTIFVVDDDAGARESVVALVGLKGYKAEGFTSAEEFLAQYDPGRKGCVVADVRMSGMSGLELLAQLRARKSLLPVVVITGWGATLTDEDRSRPAVDAIVAKPVTTKAILQALSRLPLAGGAAGEERGRSGRKRRLRKGA